MGELQRKAERAGGASTSIDVRTLKTSQYDHSTGAFVKKSLSERWHVFGDGRGRVHRDIYSAFLALHAAETVDADGVVAQQHDRQRLEAKWQELEPVLLGKGWFVETPRGETPGRRPWRARVEEAPSCEVEALLLRPGVRARGAARTERSSPALV